MQLNKQSKGKPRALRFDLIPFGPLSLAVSPLLCCARLRLDVACTDRQVG